MLDRMEVLYSAHWLHFGCVVHSFISNLFLCNADGVTSLTSPHREGHAAGGGPAHSWRIKASADPGGVQNAGPYSIMTLTST